MSTILHDVALALGYGLIGLAAGTLLVTIMLRVYAAGWLLVHRSEKKWLIDQAGGWWGSGDWPPPFEKGTFDDLEAALPLPPQPDRSTAPSPPLVVPPARTP